MAETRNSNASNIIMTIVCATVIVSVIMGLIVARLAKLEKHKLK